MLLLGDTTEDGGEGEEMAQPPWAGWLSGVPPPPSPPATAPTRPRGGEEEERGRQWWEDDKPEDW